MKIDPCFYQNICPNSSRSGSNANNSKGGESMNKSNEVINALEELTIRLATHYKERHASAEEIAALAELAKVTLQVKVSRYVKMNGHLVGTLSK